MKVEYVDPSELYRPDYKDEEKYRQFTYNEDDPIQKRVLNTYQNMHEKQTVDFVEGRRDSWCKFDKVELTIFDALEKLNDLVDSSDPDVDLPNIVHAFQTAERIREAHPDLEWFQLVGLIHDLGKIMCFYGEPQWAVVGDTFPVGCKYEKSVVYSDTTFNNNKDMKDERYNTKYGIYEKNTGLRNVLMSWGHDEYLYQVLKNHPNCTIPDEGLYMIRFHSFYPWHRNNDYDHLADDYDRNMLQWVREFNKFDLYSKTNDIPDIENLKSYYQSLIDKYIPGKVKF